MGIREQLDVGESIALYEVPWQEYERILQESGDTVSAIRTTEELLSS